MIGDPLLPPSVGVFMQNESLSRSVITTFIRRAEGKRLTLITQVSSPLIIEWEIQGRSLNNGEREREQSKSAAVQSHVNNPACKSDGITADTVSMFWTALIPLQ